MLAHELHTTTFKYPQILNFYLYLKFFMGQVEISDLFTPQKFLQFKRKSQSFSVRTNKVRLQRSSDYGKPQSSAITYQDLLQMILQKYSDFHEKVQQKIQFQIMFRSSSMTDVFSANGLVGHSRRLKSPNKLSLLKQNEKEALQSLIWLKTIKQNRENKVSISKSPQNKSAKQTLLKSMIQQITPNFEIFNRNRTEFSEVAQQTLKKSNSNQSICFFKQSDSEQGRSTAENTQRSSSQSSANNADFSKSGITSERSNSEDQNSRIEDYQLIRFFGEGSEGAVYLVKHTLTNCLYAMKKIQKSTLKSQADQNSLIKQIKIHSKLSHPNIVKLYDIFDNEQSIYMVMEFCEAGNLYQLQQKQGRLQQKRVKSIVKQLCQGIAYLHSKNIIHRDLKAENIVIQQNVVKICDFGCSSQGKDPRRTMCGTPAYLPPEIVENKLYGQKADIWSLGVLTYELFYGELPFQVECLENGTITIFESDVQFSKGVEISQDAKSFILSCLSRDPTKRCGAKQLLNHPFIKNK